MPYISIEIITIILTWCVLSVSFVRDEQKKVNTHTHSVSMTRFFLSFFLFFYLNQFRRHSFTLSTDQTKCENGITANIQKRNEFKVCWHTTLSLCLNQMKWWQKKDAALEILLQSEAMSINNSRRKKQEIINVGASVVACGHKYAIIDGFEDNFIAFIRSFKSNDRRSKLK